MMRFDRYSAVGIFGAPIDKGIDPSDREPLVRLMNNYGIEAHPVPQDSTDITPYYWRNPMFRYFLSMAHPEGPAIVELLPRHDDSMTLEIGQIAGIGYCIKDEVRKVEVPTDQRALAIVGPSPRFPGEFCVHELVTFSDEG